jgi:hypothetical protein
MEGICGTGVYMREGTTSRVMAGDRPYGEFYDFYSVSPEYFGYHHVNLCNIFTTCPRYGIFIRFFTFFPQ